jgi:hypothetical protein
MAYSLKYSFDFVGVNYFIKLLLLKRSCKTSPKLPHTPTLIHLLYYTILEINLNNAKNPNANPVSLRGIIRSLNLQCEQEK